MSDSVSHGAASRAPIYSGNRRIPGLYSRTLADGSPVFEAALRLGGKVRRRRLIASTKTDAIAELRALQTDYERGEEHRSPAAAVTLGELVEDFVGHMQSRVGDPDPKRRRAPRTVEHYGYVLRRYVVPEIGHIPAPDVRASHVVRVLDTMAARKLSPSTRTGTMTALSATFRYAVKRRAVERNVVRDLDRDDRPGASRVTEPRYLSLDEMRALLAELGDTFRPIAATCAYAGLRVSEALALRWRDVDLDGGSLIVTAQLSAKGGERMPTKTAASVGTVPMLPALVLELRRHRRAQASRNLALVHRDALVFTTATGRPQNHRNALRAVHEAGDRAKLNGDERPLVGLHDHRHSFVALALASGRTRPEASALARHANPRITAMAYAGLSDDGRAKLGERLAAAFEASS
jgi:integrase